ncbi:MAG TPA: hypothetical protein DCQ06_06620, partial [Myxococcales bacterium]|nr:hypothetical protein [Myxococcales bacterium]
MSAKRSNKRPQNIPNRPPVQSARPPIDLVELLFATTNTHKIEEFQSLCEPGLVNVIGAGTWQKDTGVKLPEVIEDAPDFIGNALLKAASAVRISGLSAVADDSGLVVSALGGKPGVHSARYAGEPRDDERNIDQVLQELEGSVDRSAHFLCALVVCGPAAEGAGCGHTEDGLAWRAFIGKVDGQILSERQGSGGFGYDSVFFSNELKQSFGQASAEDKNSISHRGRAVQRLRLYLEARARRRPATPLFIRPVGYSALVTAMCNTIERNLRFANKAVEASLAIRPQLGSKERAAISTLHWYALRNLSRLQLALQCLEGQPPQDASDPRQLKPEDASLLVCLLLADVDPMGTPLSHNLPGERSALAGLLERSPSLKGTIPLKLKMAGKG